MREPNPNFESAWGFAVCLLALAAIALLRALGPPWLSPHDAARIRVGMTRAEVEGILGRPADEVRDVPERVSNPRPGQPRVRLVWEGTPVSVRVLFADDKAQSIYAEWVGQDVWHKIKRSVEKTMQR